MDHLIAGELNPKVLAQLARARRKISQQEEALEGAEFFAPVHATLLAAMLGRIDQLSRDRPAFAGDRAAAGGGPTQSSPSAWPRLRSARGVRPGAAILLHRYQLQVLGVVESPPPLMQDRSVAGRADAWR